VDDAPDVRRSKAVAYRCRLGATQRAELEAIEVPVQELLRILDIRVPNEINPRRQRNVILKVAGLKARAG
jgi:hypothetical protein